MVLEVDYLEQQSNLISSLYNMHLGIEKIKKEPSDRYGLRELTLVPENLALHILC